MKKTLLTLFMTVAFVASALANEVVFDFTNPQALTPSVTPSAEPSTGVDLDATPFTNGGVSFTLVKGEGEKDLAARIWTNSEKKNLAKELRAYKGTTITIEAADNITSVVFKGYKVKTMTATAGTFANGFWSGSAKKVVLNVTGTLNVETVTVVVGEGGGEVKPEPQPVETVYTTIADLKKNAVREETPMTFEFKELTVIAKAGNDIYVSDGKEATLFYASENTLNVGDKISGKIKGNLTSFFGLTEVKSVDYTGVTVVSKGNAVAPIVVTLEELAAEGAFAKLESQLVVVKGVKVGAETFENLNIDMIDGATKVTLRDNYKSAIDFKFDTTASYDITGVIGQFKNKVQINLLSTEGIQVSTGIEGVEAENGEQVIYDLSGRRVAKAVKGLYIINGKKVFVK